MIYTMTKLFFKELGMSQEKTIAYINQKFGLKQEVMELRLI